MLLPIVTTLGTASIEMMSLDTKLLLLLLCYQDTAILTASDHTSSLFLLKLNVRRLKESQDEIMLRRGRLREPGDIVNSLAAKYETLWYIH